ncbi:MAG: PAS domain S-box protein [Bacteroidales bacterium]
MDYLLEALNHSSVLEFKWTNSYGLPIVDIGDGVEKIFSCSKDELRSSTKSILDIFDSSEHEYILSHIESCVSSREDVFTLRPLVLSKRYAQRENMVLLFVMPCRDTHGEVFSFSGYLFDPKTFLEEQHYLSRLATSTDQSLSVIVITDTDGNIQYVNKQFTEITHYEESEVKGLNPRVLKSGNTPRSTYEDLWSSISSGVGWRGEFHNRRKDGSLYWEKAIVWPLFLDGEITHYVAIKEDITKIKEAEDRIFRLNSILNASSEVSQILLSDRPLNETIPESLQLIVEATNFGRISLYQRDDGLQGRDSLFVRNSYTREDYLGRVDVVRGEVLFEEFLPFLEDIIKNRDIVVESSRLPGDMGHHLRSNGVRNLLVFPVFVDTQLWGVLVVDDYFDCDPFIEQDIPIIRSISNNIGMAIANNKRTMELLFSKVRAERSSNMKSRFLESLQHEIRTPLNIIYGFLDLVCAGEVSSEDSDSFVRIIRQNGDQLISTINDLVEISHIDSGLAISCSGILNIGEILYMLLDEFRLEKNSRGVDISAIVTDELLNIEASNDKDKVYAILRNLMIIILKYNSSGSVQIGCEITPISYCFTIITTGLYVEPTIISDLNRVRYRGGITSIEEEPVALKLSLIKGYIDLLKGSISVVSSLSKYRFKVCIPF